MSTTQINHYLSAFGVECDDVGIVPSKRLYVQGLLQHAPDDLVLSIARELGIDPLGTESPPAETLRSYLSEGGLSSCRRDYSRALAHVEDDPDSAIASASSTLESVCKAILDQRSRAYPADQSLQPLLSAAFECLSLSPSKAADIELKRLLGGLLNAAVAVGVLRTKFSAAHGRGDRQASLFVRHARVAVNACATVAIFLVETAGANGQPTSDG